MKILKPYIIELAKTLSQHWYNVWIAKEDGTKGRFSGVFPSSTTILNAYPQSPHLTKWIAEQGWNESQAIKTAAGERGTTIHKGIEFLLEGNGILEGAYLPGAHKPLSLEEYWKLSTFDKWFNEFQPEIIAKEMKIFSKKGGYAGTLDALIKIDGKITVIDWKSGSGLHEHFPLQFASYAKAVEENTDLKIEQTAALQLGAGNSSGYRFVIYPDWQDHYKVFKHVKETWQYENFTSKKKPKKPPVLDLPAELKLNFK